MFEFILFLLVGLGIVVVGVFVFKGNIRIIHSYHWKKVSDADKGVFCKFHGIADIVLGLCLIVTSILELLKLSQVSWIAALVGAVICLALVLYAQFKYNKGIF